MSGLMTKASVRSFCSGKKEEAGFTDDVIQSEVFLNAVFQLLREAKERKGTYKLCELFVTDAAVSSLEAFGVKDTALCVDVTETDGCQDLHGRRLLKRLFSFISIIQQ